MKRYRDRKRQELLSQLNNIQSDTNPLKNNNCKLFLGDFIEVQKKKFQIHQ